MTVMTLNIHHHGASGRPVPPLVRLVCFRWLRRFLCLRASGTRRQPRHMLQSVIEVCTQYSVLSIYIRLFRVSKKPDP